MHRIFSYVFGIIFWIVFASSLYAADAPTADVSSSSSGKTELTIKVVKTIDSTKIRIVFTESIDLTSVILKIAKQSDNSSLTIASITGVTDSPEAIDVSIDDELEEGSSYSLTIIAAISLSWATVTDGANALKDFVTPIPLKKAVKSFNAPANPSAVLTETPVKPVVPTSTPTTEKEDEILVPTEELPLTGMNPLLLLIIIFPVAYIFLRKKAL